LNVVASKLSAIQPEQDVKAVFMELHNMGKSNPIAALVSVSHLAKYSLLHHSQKRN